MRLNNFFKSFLLVSAGFLFSLQSVYSEIFELDDTPASVPESSDKEYALNAKMALSNPDYPVTAGDIYTLSFVAGKTPVSYPITVDTTYSLKIANLGVIKNCDGLTYKALKRQVESLVSKNYPMGAAQFILTSPGVFSVKVTGQVKKASEVNAWALTRLSEIVTRSVTQYSSLRNVKIVSSSGKTRVCDLFKASRDGDFSNDPYLRPGDTVEVGRISRRVSISGAVERPGTYELLDGEELGRLVGYYGGGLTERADPSRMSLTRILNEKSSGKVVYLDETAITDNYALLCYDSLFVTSLNDINPVLFLQGAVSQKAPDSSEAVVPEATTSINITVKNGTNYASVVRDNAGLFSSVSDLKNAYIIRKEKEEKDGAVRITEKHIPINLEEILYNQEFYSSEYVQNKDILLVPFRQFFVTVAGAVPNPGRYSYIPDRDWSYYVGLAGGIDTYRNSLKAVTITDVDGKRYSKKDNIIPEMTIEVEENSGWYKWNRISGGITAILTILSSTLSILAVTGVF